MKTEFAPFWVVRFETKHGDYHPVYFGRPNDPEIIDRKHVEAEAKIYLKQQSSWLKRIDSIYAPHRDAFLNPKPQDVNTPHFNGMETQPGPNHPNPPWQE